MTRTPYIDTVTGDVCTVGIDIQRITEDVLPLVLVTAGGRSRDITLLEWLSDRYVEVE